MHDATVTQQPSLIQIDPSLMNAVAEPKCEDFLVSKTRAEHDKIIDRLITGEYPFLGS
jgi:hypothetical protein